jgi:hypothetical protein
VVVPSLCPKNQAGESFGVEAVEPDGAFTRAETTPKTVAGVPTMVRLLRIGPNGHLNGSYGSRVAGSLARLSASHLPQVPEVPTDAVLRRGGRIALVGRGERGGWVVEFNHDGSLDHEFGHDGYRWVDSHISAAASQKEERLLLLGYEQQAGMTINVLDSNGRRDPRVGGEHGDRIASLRGHSFGELVSSNEDRPLVYFDRSSFSCEAPSPCVEPTELLRLGLFHPSIAQNQSK